MLYVGEPRAIGMMAYKRWPVYTLDCPLWPIRMYDTHKAAQYYVTWHNNRGATK